MTADQCQLTINGLLHKRLGLVLDRQKLDNEIETIDMCVEALRQVKVEEKP